MIFKKSMIFFKPRTPKKSRFVTVCAHTQVSMYFARLLSNNPYIFEIILFSDIIEIR